MGKFSELNLKWFEEEDLEDLEEEFHISEMSVEDLDALASKLYWDAQSLYGAVTRLEGQSELIQEYIRLIST